MGVVGGRNKAEVGSDREVRWLKMRARAISQL